jgi:NAD-dependent deacetylase
MTQAIAPQVFGSKIATIQARLQTACHVVALTGAGMSQESGLPTYRSAPDALWSNSVVAEVATLQALRADPQKVWKWHQAFAQRISAASPNAGHLALARLQATCPVTVVTQNVDDLHERAGSNQVIHLHGSAFAHRCFACKRPMSLPLEMPNDWGNLREHVRCASCHGHIRNDVVLFGEKLDPTRFAAARKAIRDCDVVLVIGTSNLIYPAAELPHYAMKRHKFVVEINPQETPMSSWVSARIALTASEGLAALVG